MTDMTQPATLGNVQRVVENMKVYVDSDKTTSIKGYLKKNNTHNFYNTSTPTEDTTPIFSFDVGEELFLDQTKTTFVQEFEWSDENYPNSANPNLEGKPVLVLAVKGEDDVIYSFVNLETLVDTYKTKNTATLSLDITDNEISGNVNISTEDGNAVVVKYDGLYVPTIAETKISEVDGNQVEVKEDGLFVKDMSTKVSNKDGNAVSLEDDGLYVPTVSETKVSEIEDNIIEIKEDGIYVAPIDLSDYETELSDGVVTSEKIADKAVTLEKIDFTHLEKGDNLFNKDAAATGYYVSYSNGKLSAADGFVASDYIEIEANETYAMSSFEGGMQTAFYDADKNFISGVLHTASVLTATSPADAKYMRTTTTTTNLATFAVCKGTTATYSAYVESWKIDKDVLPDSGASMSNFIVVSADGSGDYTTVTEAVLNAKSGSIIYVRNGEYDNEEIEAWGKTVSIIGEDKHKTIIKNGLNTYSRPPIEMASGLLRNLTIYAYDGGADSLDDNGWFAYGLHVEANILSGNSLTVENCIIKCDKNAAIGAGLRKDGVLSISNCELWGTKGLFWHDAASSSYAGEETIIVKDCIIGSHTSATVMRVDSQCQADAVVNCHFIRNIFCSDVGDATVFFNNTGSGDATEVGTFGDLIGFYKGVDCYMNTIDVLNNSVETVSTTGCTLVDTNTGITYELQVVDGKLTMVEV